ncbi:hypothetical protein C2E23DRAFT_897371 [Lenzites betulinus]|nr:hypothetical protein C2E23DRAFT_897371 [Lenzites betulinus]
MAPYYPPSYPGSSLPVVFYVPYTVQWSTPPPWAIPSPAPSLALKLPSAPAPRIIPLVGATEDPSHGEPAPAPKLSAPLTPAPRRLTNVDPVIAYTRNPTYSIDLVWDLMQDPRTLLSTRGTLSSCAVISWGDLTLRCAARVDGKPLRSLVLVFRYLPLQIEIKPWRPSGARDTPQGDAACVSVWDVLNGLYDGLRGPVDPTMVSSMPQCGSERPEDVLYRAAKRRLALLPDDRRPGEPLIRKVDFLRGRRRFLGIRVAERDEVPKGRRLGEVFVVEVGNSQS